MMIKVYTKVHIPSNGHNNINHGDRDQKEDYDLITDYAAIKMMLLLIAVTPSLPGLSRDQSLSPPPPRLVQPSAKEDARKRSKYRLNIRYIEMQFLRLIEYKCSEGYIDRIASPLQTCLHL